jgi:transposase-like protein
VAAFCRQRGLPASQFFAWKKRLSQAATGQFVEVQVARTEEPAQLTAAHSQAIEIRLSGRCVFVEPGFDADHLRAVLAALDARA